MDDALAALLEAERALLLAGDLAGLDALAPGKAAALARLEAAPLDAAAPGAAPEAARALAAALARNQALLRAAIDGVREAARRRAALEEARTRLPGYDARGARPAAVAPSRVERRA